MPYVNTLLGTIHPEEMGATAVDECLMSGLHGWEWDPDAWFKIDKAFEKCYNELMDFRLQGGRTYVDCGGIGSGRDIDIYVKLAAASTVQIVASTGFRMEHGMAGYFQTKDVGYFEDLFLRELTEGMAQTSIKAGVISVGSGPNALTRLEKDVFRGAARAARKTGAAVISHGAVNAEHYIEIFRDENLDLARVVLSGCDEVIDLDRDQRMAAAGAYVSYCRLGVEGWSRKDYAMPDNDRLKLVEAMLGAGFQDRLLLSSGSDAWSIGSGEISLNNVGHPRRYFVPRMKAAGIGDEVLDRIFVDNPKRVLPIQ